MPLSCSCDEPEDGYTMWYMDYTDEFKFVNAEPAKCDSCGDLVNQGDLCTALECMRPPTVEELKLVDDEGEEIYQEDSEIEMDDQYLCEFCGDWYDQFIKLGFCVVPSENMRELFVEYQELSASEQNACNEDV